MTHSLRALVLGTAAGGGLPQWNCGCPNCNKARHAGSGIAPQTQSSLAVSADGEHWAILNTSPDIRQQMTAHEVLHPKSVRHTPVSSVLLTNGDIDHIAGLLILREKQAFTVFLTTAIMEVIEQNPIFNALDRHHVTFQVIDLETQFTLAPGLEASLFAVPGKVPLFMEGEIVDTKLEGDQTVGVQLTAQNRTAFYIPGCAAMTPSLEEKLRYTELVFFDGTVFENEEMISTKTGQKTGARMGHMAMSGQDGSVAAFEKLGVKQKVFVHINNTNPVWDPDSRERATVEAAGWAIAHDGLEIAL